jgi:hypothetical protein
MAMIEFHKNVCGRDRVRFDVAPNLGVIQLSRIVWIKIEQFTSALPELNSLSLPIVLWS